MKKIFKLLTILLTVLTLTGCVSAKPYVAYTVYPVGYAINRISGGILDTKSIQTNAMVQVATVNEDYQDILENSSYFFHIGNLEPYLDIYRDEIKETNVKTIDLSSLNAIYKFQRYTMVYVDGKESFIEGPYYNSDLFKDVDMNENDLLLWMDPIGMLSIANDIYNVLANNYVEEKARFEKNYKALESDLISLDAAYHSLALELQKENQAIKFVSVSASFGNWQKAYGFQVYPICLSKYGALPSEAELEVIKKRIIDDDVKYIAYEPNMTEEMTILFNTIEDELGLTRVNLNNISSLTPTQIANNKDYVSLMYENLNVLESMKTSIFENTKSEKR